MKIYNECAIKSDNNSGVDENESFGLILPFLMLISFISTIPT